MQVTTLDAIECVLLPADAFALDRGGILGGTQSVPLSPALPLPLPPALACQLQAWDGVAHSFVTVATFDVLIQQWGGVGLFAGPRVADVQYVSTVVSVTWPCLWHSLLAALLLFV